MDEPVTKKKKGLLWWVAVIIILMAIGSFIPSQEDRLPAERRAVISYLRSRLNDPKSYDPVSWYDAQPFARDGYKSQIRHTYRAKNGYGATVLNDQMFYIGTGGRVLVAVNFGEALE